MQRRIQIVAGIVLTVAVAAVFYFLFFGNKPSGKISANSNTNSETGTTTPQFRDPLTGTGLDQPRSFFAINVMLDNFFDVKTHPGMDKASIVYEALAEGDITRWLAVFNSADEVSQFGPIRSLRPYFLDWASEYGGILMHVGGSFDALNKVKKQTLVTDIDQIGANERYFTRVTSRAAPHNVFSSYSSWLEIAERFSVPTAQFSPWRYAEPGKTGLSGHQIDIQFAPDNHVSWVYNADTNSYLRFLNTDRQLYDTGKQLSASNVLVIEVKSKVIDDLGRRSMQTIGTGLAIVYTNAKRVEGTWTKAGLADRMRFIDTNQKEIVFVPGSTWIEVVPDVSMVSYKILP